MWNYAKFSKAAKIVGGPEQLVKFFVESGIKKRHWQMVVFLPVVFLLGTMFPTIVNYFNAKKHESEQELKAAEQKMILEIKEFDETHKEDSDNE